LPEQVNIFKLANCSRLWYARPCESETAFLMAFGRVLKNLIQLRKSWLNNICLERDSPTLLDESQKFVKFRGIAMDVFDAIQKRYSSRSYQDRPIEQEKLLRILEAARLAPSAKNLQDWRFVVVTDRAKKHKLAKAANNQMFIAQAGAIVAACSVEDQVMRCGQPVGPIDVAIAMEHIALQATTEGLATCWIGSFDPDKVRQILEIPEDVDIIELMSLGYPADKATESRRLLLEKIVCYESWRF